jgi:hypothetical protein
MKVYNKVTNPMQVAFWNIFRKDQGFQRLFNKTCVVFFVGAHPKSLLQGFFAYSRRDSIRGPGMTAAYDFGRNPKCGKGSSFFRLYTINA